MKILIVEDEKRLADSLRTLLEGKGFEVETVYDGQTGSAYAELGIYDLLILDVMMPGMDGYELARRVRAQRCSTPILMLTARSSTEDRIQGLNAGADYYLTKPFDTRELLACINALLLFDVLYYENGLGLESAVAENICLKGSEAYLSQLMEILLDNARKYSHPGGSVKVRLERQRTHCLLTVENQGEPISHADLKNIFKRFYRADKARSADGSYGLGLAIAESIVKAHKGKIWAESENGLNRFFVRLPIASSAVQDHIVPKTLSMGTLSAKLVTESK